MSVQKQSPSGKRRGSPESEVCGYDSVVREKGMNVMRERLERFMMGRYGADELTKVLNAAALVCIVLSMFGGKWHLLGLFYWIGFGLLVYTCFRMLSRNVSKRQQENQRFLNARYQGAVKRNAAKKRWEQRDIYRFYKCPGCSQRVRVPKGKGKICITCPKCRTEFVKKS